MNPKNQKEFKKLVDAVRESRRKLEPFREKRKSLLSLFVGDQYSDDGEAKRVYLNLIALATSVYVRQLAVRAPTARIVTPFTELRPKARDFSLACADVAEETKLGPTLRRAVTDALFSPMATLKVGLSISGQEDVYGQSVPVTEPFVKLVSFDDYVRDMSARSAYDPAFEGDAYTMPLAEVLERYPAAKGLDLKAQDTTGGDSESGSERAESLSHPQGIADDDIRQKVVLQDIWLPKERKLVTYVLQKPTIPLEVVEYDGEEEGPYRNLWFTPVPDNAMPLPPFSVLRNINELANSLFRRMAAQSNKQKRLVGFNDEESAKRFGQAKDGGAIFWSGTKPEKLEVDGIDQRTMALFIQVKDLFSWVSGNLDSMGGLSPMAETAKQDEMLMQSASAQIADMQDAVTVFAQDVFKSIAWYEWTDPIRERVLQKTVPGTDVSIPVLWTPETRQGDFLDFNFTIIPQSMREDSPAAKISKLNNILQQMILPMMPLFESQGLAIDARKLLMLISDYSNLPELEDVVIAADPAMQEPGMQPAGNPQPEIRMPAHTSREYIRTNRPGATRVGKDMSMIQTLLGGGVQPSEGQAMFQGVS